MQNKFDEISSMIRRRNSETEIIERMKEIIDSGSDNMKEVGKQLAQDNINLEQILDQLKKQYKKDQEQEIAALNALVRSNSDADKVLEQLKKINEVERSVEDISRDEAEALEDLIKTVHNLQMSGDKNLKKYSESILKGIRLNLDQRRAEEGSNFDLDVLRGNYDEVIAAINKGNSLTSMSVDLLKQSVTTSSLESKFEAYLKESNSIGLLAYRTTKSLVAKVRSEQPIRQLKDLRDTATAGVGETSGFLKKLSKVATNLVQAATAGKQDDFLRRNLSDITQISSLNPRDPATQPPIPEDRRVEDSTATPAPIPIPASPTAEPIPIPASPTAEPVADPVPPSLNPPTPIPTAEPAAPNSDEGERTRVQPPQGTNSPEDDSTRTRLPSTIPPILNSEGSDEIKEQLKNANQHLDIIEKGILQLLALSMQQNRIDSDIRDDEENRRNIRDVTPDEKPSEPSPTADIIRDAEKGFIAGLMDNILGTAIGGALTAALPAWAAAIKGGLLKVLNPMTYVRLLTSGFEKIGAVFKPILSLVGDIGSLAKAGAGLLRAGRVIPIIGQVIAIGMAIFDFFSGFLNASEYLGKTAEATTLWDRVSVGIGSLIGGIGGIFDSILGLFGIETDIKGFLKEKVVDFMLEIPNKAAAFIDGVIGTIKDIFTGDFDSLKERLASFDPIDVVGQMFPFLKPIIGGIKDFLGIDEDKTEAAKPEPTKTIKEAKVVADKAVEEKTAATATAPNNNMVMAKNTTNMNTVINQNAPIFTRPKDDSHRVGLA